MCGSSTEHVVRLVGGGFIMQKAEYPAKNLSAWHRRLLHRHRTSSFRPLLITPWEWLFDQAVEVSDKFWRGDEFEARAILVRAHGVLR